MMASCSHPLMTTKKSIIIVCLAGAALIILWMWATGSTAKIDVSLKNDLDAVINDASSTDDFSGTVLIGKDKKILYERAVGMSDISRAIPNTSETRFAIGSITKLFTKVLILQLVEEGDLSLDDTLGIHLGDFVDPLAESVTVAQLLDHTSGFGNYFDDAGWDEANGRIGSIDDLTTFIRNETLLFAPGAQAEYSNSGYVLLGAIIQKVTERSYEEVLQEKILEPLNMKNTAYSIINDAQPDKAIGYFVDGASGDKKDNLSLRLVGASDGGIFTTTEDLSRFVISLMNDEILLDNENKTRIFAAPALGVTYASWQEILTNGSLKVSGGDPGVSAALSIKMPKKEWVIVLSNYSEGTADAVLERLEAVLSGTVSAESSGPRSAQEVGKEVYVFAKNNPSSTDIRTFYKDLYSQAGIPAGNDMPLLYAGQPLLEEKSVEAAIALYEVYTEDFPQIIVSWNDLGDAYLLNGEREKAVNAYRRALDLQPDNSRANAALQELQ